MKSSIFYSTLSLAFAVCIVSVIVMIFMNISPDKELLAIITGVIAAYLTARNPNTSFSASTTETDNGRTTVISTTPEVPPPLPTKPKKK